MAPAVGFEPESVAGRAYTPAMLHPMREPWWTDLLMYGGLAVAGLAAVVYLVVVYRSTEPPDDRAERRRDRFR